MIMKESRYFYVPDASSQFELPEEEALHASKVLRLQTGDEVFLMDGVGRFYRAELTDVSKKHCLYSILETMPQEKAWHSEIHVAIAPTKNIDRIEWMVEKCTEVGVDSITFINCAFSERRHIRLDRIEKIAVSAAKQSRKPYYPLLHDLADFKSLVDRCNSGRRFICHCYSEFARRDLFEELKTTDINMPVTIFIGPEGDFSVDEVRYALTQGFESVSLGSFRLRTETAGLIAATYANLAKRTDSAHDSGF